MASNIYESIKVGLKVDGLDVDISPNFFSFVFTESIHSLIPSMTFTFQDYLGMLNESLFFCEGKKFSIILQDGKYDENEIEKVFDLVVSDNDAEFSNKNDAFLSTNNKVKAFHEFYNNDEIKSKAYEDNSSTIVQNLVDAYLYRFNNTNIQTSDDRKIYYQPLKSDIQFIDDIIKKEAYNTDETPYFCFIDSFNDFNYVTYNNMMLQEKVGSLSDLPEDPFKPGRGLILNYSILNVGSNKTRKEINKDVYLYKGNGELETTEIKILDLTGNDILPIVKNEDKKTSYIYNNNESYDTTEEKNIKGRNIYNSKDSFFIERLQVLTPYDYKFRSGRVIDVTLHLSNTQEVIESIYYTGEYLIEVNNIVWDGDSQILQNSLILSRCKFTIDDSLNIKPELIQS